MNGYVPGGTDASTLIVTVDEVVLPMDVTIWFGPLPLNDTVTPAGPENDNETVSANPFSEATYRFVVPDDPWATEMPVLERAIEKSPVAVCATAIFCDKEASVISNTTATRRGTSR